MSNRTIPCFALCLFIQAACAQQSNQVYQYSTMSALMAGEYDGVCVIGELLTHGNFGMGTIDGLDGEMIILEGVPYRAALDGSISIIQESAELPFATLTYFAADRKYGLPEETSFAALCRAIDSLVPDPASVYAFKIAGTFRTLKTRSVPKQQRPFKPLTEALKGQSVLNQENVQGTMVGFRYPATIGGVNAPGYHFHFISADKKTGGHVLDCSATGLLLEAGRQQSLHVRFLGEK